MYCFQCACIVHYSIYMYKALHPQETEVLHCVPESAVSFLISCIPQLQ